VLRVRDEELGSNDHGTRAPHLDLEKTGLLPLKHGDRFMGFGICLAEQRAILVHTLDLWVLTLPGSRQMDNITVGGRLKRKGSQLALKAFGEIATSHVIEDAFV
jgi:hypothetical protein